MSQKHRASPCQRFVKGFETIRWFFRAAADIALPHRRTLAAKSAIKTAHASFSQRSMPVADSLVVRCGPQQVHGG